MIYAFAEGIGFSIVIIVLGALSLKRARRGNAKPWTLYVAALAVYALALIGVFAGGFDGQDLIDYGCVAVFAIVFYVRIAQAVG